MDRIVVLYCSTIMESYREQWEEHIFCKEGISNKKEVHISNFQAFSCT